MRSSKYLKALFFSVVTAFLVMPVEAKVAPVPLEQLIKQSDLIVVGKVSAIRQIEGIEFAEVEISKKVKGDPRTSLVYSAEKTWPCDMSDAVDGETALFFFKNHEIGPGFRRNSEQAILLKQSVAKLFNLNDLFRLGFDGRGRMPVNMSGGEQLLSVNPSIIRPVGLGYKLTDILHFTHKVLANS